MTWRYLANYDGIAALRAKAMGLALRMCRAQRSFGDFRLKTTIAVATCDLITLCDALDRKLVMLDIGQGPANAAAVDDAELISTGSAAQQLTVLASDAQRVAALATAARERLSTYIDIRLATDLDTFGRAFERDLRALLQWNHIGPSEASELRADLGLLRDCELYDSEILRDPERAPRRLAEVDLRDPLVRCGYLSANAYLELSALDIVADLIWRAWTSEYPDRRRLVADLNRQLLDEARHAEMLAARVEALDYALGCAPVCLHTWRVHQSFDTLPEQIVAQQVLQEGIGLDSSALNVVRMARVGDRETADVYAQITADERVHVELGLRWAAQLSTVPIEAVMAEVIGRVESLSPLPAVPVAVELRRRCRYPETWLAREVAAKGALDSSVLRQAITGAARG